MKKLAVAAFAVIAIALGSHVVSAYAYTCTTNCNSYGNQTNCTRTCF